MPELVSSDLSFIRVSRQACMQVERLLTRPHYELHECAVLIEHIREVGKKCKAFHVHDKINLFFLLGGQYGIIQHSKSIPNGGFMCRMCPEHRFAIGVLLQINNSLELHDICGVDGVQVAEERLFNSCLGAG